MTAIRAHIGYRAPRRKKANLTEQEKRDRLGHIVNERMDRHPETPLYKVRSMYLTAVNRLQDNDFYAMANEYGWHR